MPGNETVFISYRRDDSGVQAQQLRNQLAGLLHQEAVFFDLTMRTGIDFPDAIQQALARVKLVLVVIGPGWLEAMKDRATGTAKTDWVFEEVKGALGRLSLKDGLMVLPLLLPGAQMPAEGTLPAALDTLWRQNAAHLKAQAQALLPGTDALLMLLHNAGLVSYEPRDDAATLAALGKKVKALLDLPHMKAIASEWDDPPTTPSLGTNIPAAIAKLTLAIPACAEQLRKLDTKDKAAIQTTCQSLLTLLCNMAADFALVQHWRLSDGGWIVPADKAGYAVNLVASALNAEAIALHPPVQLTPIDARDPANANVTREARHPAYANVIDTGVPGIGADQTAHLHAALWAQLRKLPAGLDLLGDAYPIDAAAALVHGSPNFDRLKGAVEIAKLLNCPVIVAHELKSATPSHGQVRQDAATLGLNYLAYGAEGLWLTRCSPSLLNPARMACQQTINRILDL